MKYPGSRGASWGGCAVLALIKHTPHDPLRDCVVCARRVGSRHEIGHQSEAAERPYFSAGVG
jgi:hypothetical protein